MPQIALFRIALLGLIALAVDFSQTSSAFGQAQPSIGLLSPEDEITPESELAQGMTGDRGRRLNRWLDGALKLIANVQCEDGGWDYKAHQQKNGHDLSLAVMQAKALRSAVDSGLEVPPEVIELAIKSVREHYAWKGDQRLSEAEQKKLPGQFTY